MGNSDLSKMAKDEKNEHFKEGDRVGMSFTFNNLEHNLYGKTVNVTGIIPLLVTYGNYTKPCIIHDKDKLKTIVHGMTREYQPLWENELDDEVASKIKDFLLFGAFTNPLEDVTSDKMQTYISVIILIFAIDDLCDQLTDNSNKSLKYSDIKKMTQFLINIFEGVYESLDEMSNPIKAIECANAFIWKSKSMCEVHIPNFLDKNKYVKQEWVTVLSSYVLFTEANSGFSERSKILFGSYQAGVCGYLELFALIRNLTISDEIRSHVLFQRMRVAAGSVSNLMNDIFGLERDMILGQVKDTSILRKVVDNNVTLQDAMQNTLKHLCDEINDVRMCIIKLRICYEENKDLLEYLSCLEIMLDGQLYWYEYTERYKNSNLKMVKII